MATWKLKDLRYWCIEHPLAGAKISTEQDYPFHWEFSSLTLKLHNFEGTFDNIARGDRVIIHNRTGTEIRFAGIVDSIKSNPKTYYLEVYILNDAIILKDETPSGIYEKNEKGEYTGNVIISVNAVTIEQALKNALYSLSGTKHLNIFTGITYDWGTKRFNPDFASSEQFADTPYSQSGTICPIYFRRQNGGYFYYLNEKNTYVRYYFPTFAFCLIGENIKLVYIRRISVGAGSKARETKWIIDGDHLILESEEEFKQQQDYPEIVNELPIATDYPKYIIEQAIDILNFEYPLSSDEYTYRDVFKVWKYNNIYYYLILDVKKRYTNNIVDYTKNEGVLRWWFGRTDSIVNNISYHYTNPKMIDIVKDMAILTNALWWVTQEANTSLPTLHFYPRETIYATVDIAQYRARIDDIDEEFIYREFDREISDNVILSDLLKNNIKKYYQEQSGEYVKTKIKLFAREIGDTFGVTIMADVKYGKYTIGRALAFEFLDEHTTVIICMKSSKTYKRWYR